MTRNAIRKLAGALSIATAAVASACDATEPQDGAVYQLVPLSTRDINVQVEASGTVEPIRTIEVKSKASGEIFEMNVEIGDEVRAGEVLLRVDPRVPEAQLRQALADSVLAQAELETAQSQMRRAEQLHETDAITEVELEDARLAVASARASLIQAERSLEDARISAEDTEVSAPLSGVVIDKRVEEGSVITSATGMSAGSVLLTMADLDTVQIRSLVDETDIGRVRPGLQVTITVEAYPNSPFHGQVLKIEPLAEVTSNVTMFPVLVKITNEDGLLRPGMNGEVVISVGRRRNVVAVPNNALRTFRDFTSAAVVLGLDPRSLRQRLMETRGGAQTSGAVPQPNADFAAGDSGMRGAGMRLRQMELPEGVTVQQVRSTLRKLRTEGADALTESEHAMLEQIDLPGPPQGGFAMGQASGGPAASSSDDPLAADYIVFVMRDSVPTPTWIRTGLSDGTYSEVLSGVTAADTVLALPNPVSAGVAEGSGPGGGRGMGRGMGRGGGGPPPPR